jgi:anti-sigma factor RsiW
MTCREAMESLAEYLSDGLPSERRVAFDAHLATCPDCVAYLRSYAEAVQMAKGAFNRPEDLDPEDVPEELVRAILRARRTPS